MFLHFNVVEQNITKSQERHLVNYSKNYLYLSFTFNPTWNDFTKYIIFNNKCVYELEYNSEKQLYIIPVPSDVLKEKYFTFSIYGILIVDQNETRITTENITVKLHESGYTTFVHEGKGDDGITDVFTILKEGLKEVNHKLDSKADKVHIHHIQDILDYDENIRNEFEAFCNSLANKIIGG